MVKRTVLILTASLLAACAGPSASSRKVLNAKIAAGDFIGAQASIKRNKELAYGRKNAVLYYLDLGAVEHDAGQYKDSASAFAAAEDRMDELYTKSVHKEAAMLLLNDNTADYTGEVFERALTNVYRALNYVFLGQSDEALVEARKVERYLTQLNDTSATRRAYKDDAFARYIDSILYSDASKIDDARISYEAAQAAYRAYETAYHTPTPPFPSPLTALPKGFGELIFLHYNGTAPRKISSTFSVAWNDALLAIRYSNDAEAQSAQVRNALAAGITGNNITVAYPNYVQDPFRIASSEILVDGQSTGRTALVEDISAIATRDLSDRVALVKTRAIARAAIKYILAKSASDTVAKRYGRDSLPAVLARTATSALTAATEIADTRSWATLPAQIRMARVPLAAGQHEILARFYDAYGALVIQVPFQGVTIQAGRRTYLHHRTAL